MRRTLLIWITIAGLAPAAEPGFRQSGFQPGPAGQPAGWTSWAPRSEIAPRTFVDPVHYRKTPGSLAISGSSNPAVCGGWEHQVQGIRTDQWYRLTAYYRAEGLDYEPRQVVARLNWLSPAGKRAGQPDYAYKVTREGDWNRVMLEAPAPTDATAVALQFYLWYAPRATVWWDDISLEPINGPKPRPVTIVAINLRPNRTGSAEASVGKFVETIDKTVKAKTDIILLPEGITVVGTGKKYVDVAEPVPGPTTAHLGEVARAHNSYIVAGIYEREGPAVYNTAVLLDRTGRVAGKYRKVYLPREETEGGLVPGSDYPVFQTDFGRVGMMICWDLQYADPARALALRGAEMILMPIWGGNEVLGKARAIENQVFLATSGYDYPTYILDPNGEVLSIATAQGTAAVATVDLSRRYTDKWLGFMRGRFMKELRLDVPVDPGLAR
jgi:predicted amidohydrolase